MQHSFYVRLDIDVDEDVDEEGRSVAPPTRQEIHRRLTAALAHGTAREALGEAIRGSVEVIPFSEGPGADQLRKRAEERHGGDDDVSIDEYAAVAIVNEGPIGWVLAWLFI